uniref:Uncharacterized protein n=1 Tax=Aegilops tauschii TaxID=37682 RepID=R7W500_AEGTA
MHAAISYAALSPLQLPLPYLPPPLPPLLPLLSPPPPAAVDAGFQSRISPKILLIVLILAVIFFVSGLLHLLVWLLFRPTPRDPGDAGSSAAHATAFHGQLQQLLHLHDAGVDQSFIDALPVFLYGAVVGAGGKDPFDCAVCLLVMEQEEGCESQTHSDVKEKDEVVVPVKLGKFRSQATEGGAGCSSNPDQDVRRCYSMGTYEYVMDQSSLLRVSVKPPAARLSKPTMDKKESFSISKIWMRGGLRRKDSSAAPSGSSSRRASSFRLPSALQRAASDIGAPKRRADVRANWLSKNNMRQFQNSFRIQLLGFSFMAGLGSTLDPDAQELPDFEKKISFIIMRGVAIPLVLLAITYFPASH